MNNLKRSFCIITSCVIMFLTFSCKNFFAGQEFIQELEQVIEYVNSQKITVYFVSDVNTGTILPSGEKECAKSDVFKLAFTEAPGYQFIGWEVLDSDTNTPVSDVARIKDISSKETEVEIINAYKNVKIHSVCIERPGVLSYTPSYSDKGEPKDSSIVISFSKTISTDNDFSKIQITSNGDSIRDNYLQPVLNENILLFPADKSNLLQIGSGNTKLVIVTIPSDIYYEDNERKIPIGTELSFSFLLNNSTNDKAEITCGVSLEKGTMVPSGTNNYNLGDIINIKYIPSEDYLFEKWNVLDSYNNAVDSSVIKVDDETALSTKIEVKDAAKGLSIVPICHLVPKVKSFSPDTSISSVSCDNPVVVNFNKSVKVDSINFESIKINDNYGHSLSGYFKTPEPILDLTSNLLCTGFTIKFDYSKKNLFESQILNNVIGLEITISLDETIKDEKENSLCGKINYSYRVNNKFEDKKPVITEIYFSKEENSAVNKKNTLARSEYTRWSEDDYKKNHVNSVWVNLSAIDEESGVDKLIVKETLLFDKEKNQKNQSKTISYSMGNSKQFKYEFQNNIDGLVLLEFFVTDLLGNESLRESLYLIKDTALVLPDIDYFVSTSAGDSFGESMLQYTYDSVEELKKAISTIYLCGFTNDTWYDDKITSYRDFEYEIVWNGKNGKQILKNPSYIESKRTPSKVEPVYGFELPVDTIFTDKETEYTISIKDEAGNELLINDKILPAVEIQSAIIKKEDPINGEISICILNNGLKYKNNFICYYQAIDKVNSTIKTKLQKYYTLSGSEFSIKNLNTKDNYYYICLFRYSTKGVVHSPSWFYGTFTDPIKVDGEQMNIVSEENVQNDLLEKLKFDFTIESAGVNTGSYNLTFTIPETLFVEYDLIEPYYQLGKYDPEANSLISNKTNTYFSPMKSNSQTYNLGYKAILHTDNHTDPYVFKLSDEGNLIKIGIRYTKGNNQYLVKYDSLPEFLNYAVDNVPPDVTTISVKPRNEQNEFFIKVPDSVDELSKMAKNSSGNYYGKMFFVPTKSEWKGYSSVSQIVNLSVEEIKKNSYSTDFEFPPENIGKDVIVKFTEILPEGEYVVCFEISDEKGNTAIAPAQFLKKTANGAKPTIVYDESNHEMGINYLIQGEDGITTGTYGNTSKAYCMFTIEAWNEGTKSWDYFTLTRQGQNFKTDSYEDSSYKGKDTIFQWKTSLDDIRNKFIKATILEVLSDNKGYDFCKPLYFYTSPNSSTGILNIRDGKYFALCDEPCLMSTVYSQTDLGNSVDSWELNTASSQHLNTSLVKNLQAYTPADVPDNMYYCVIVHYADGSSQMSEVMKK